MKLAVKLSKRLDQYLCNNHILECAVRDSFGMTAGMDDALQIGKDLASLTHQSTVAAELLESESDAQGINFRQLRKSVDTRWNSELDCMAFVQHLKSEITSLCANEDIFSSKTISASQWKSIEGAVEMLAPLKEAIETWLAESIPTINTVAKYLYLIHDKIDQFIETDGKNGFGVFYAKNLKNCIEKRFPLCHTGSLLSAAAKYLNPALKGLHLKLFKKFQTTKEWLASQVKDNVECQPVTRVLSADLSLNSKLKRKLNVRCETQEPTSELNPILSEMCQYEYLPDVKKDFPILD
ncbi:E3 SUMO-protein ligase ZBED1-like [Hydra vulgaris]|uniref:E3 SUMO-protein ligase ZBED1-like n=1 Tax=Hydra vulgaris TaxID=6087 RepID=A0ABM4B0P0_HYDVU